MSDVEVPAGLLAEVRADLAAGGERAARWAIDCPQGSRALCLVVDGNDVTAEMFAGRVGVAPYGNTAWLEFGEGSSSSQMWAAVPVGSADDPDSPRPAKGDRVLVLESKWFPERQGEVARHIGDGRDGRICVNMLAGRPDIIDINRWAILPAPWPAVPDEAVPGDPGRDEARLVAAIAALIPDPPSNHIPDWPTDEQEYARNGHWLSFSDREVGLRRLRREKLARRIAEMVENRPPTMWAYDRACEALAKHRQRADEMAAELDRVRQAAATTANAVTQTLGAVLGYPRDEAGPVVGEQVPEVMAREAAERIRRLTEEGEALREVVREAASLQEKGRDRRDRDREEIERLRAALASLLGRFEQARNTFTGLPDSYYAATLGFPEMDDAREALVAHPRSGADQ